MNLFLFGERSLESLISTNAAKLQLGIYGNMILNIEYIMTVFAAMHQDIYFLDVWLVKDSGLQAD